MLATQTSVDSSWIRFMKKTSSQETCSQLWSLMKGTQYRLKSSRSVRSVGKSSRSLGSGPQLPLSVRCRYRGGVNLIGVKFQNYISRFTWTRLQVSCVFPNHELAVQVRFTSTIHIWPHQIWYDTNIYMCVYVYIYFTYNRNIYLF